MSLRVIDGGRDDEDDFADRDEDPREEIGYREAERQPPQAHPTLEPRGRKPPKGAGRFAIVWLAEGTPHPDGAQEPRRPDLAPTRELRCKPREHGGCGQPTPTLHADPRSSSNERNLCGRCEGDVNRDRLDGGRR